MILLFNCYVLYRIKDEKLEVDKVTEIKFLKGCHNNSLSVLRAYVPAHLSTESKEVKMFKMRNILNCLFILIMVLFLNSSASAAPSVNGFSGSIIDGAPITIYGSGFGANGPNIVLFDNFESGTQGSNIKTGAGSATIGKWDFVGGGTGKSIPVYDSSFSVSGTKAMKSDYTKDYGSSAQVFNLNSNDIFLSYWVYLPTTSTFPCTNTGTLCNWKISWLYGTDTTQDDQVIPVGLPSDNPSAPFSSWAISCNDCYSSHTNWFSWNMYKGRWYRIWAWIRATGDSTGRKEVWVMGKDDDLKVTQKVNWTGRIFDTMGTNFLKFSMSAYARQCVGCTESAPRYDDVYLATGTNSRARIEIGNASTYNACTNLAIATVTSWSNTQITATLRQGALGTLKNAYVYVFDSNGNVNLNGYPLCPDCPGNPTELIAK